MGEEYMQEKLKKTKVSTLVTVITGIEELEDGVKKTESSHTNATAIP